MMRIRHVRLSDLTGTILPTAIAVGRADGAILTGEAALSASPEDYDLLLNWKLLLGKTPTALSKERAENESISRILERYSLEEVAAFYFGALMNRLIASTGAGEKPNVIIGIPAIADVTQDWRSRYKRTIERAFARTGLPSPKFFQEPFAVFQHHWNRQDFPDTGRHQNILVVDIGGGTTNVCLIQTTQHGRLARGGVNHIPHGVRSIEVGGSDIDRFILERLLPSRLASYDARAMLSASHAKERLSLTLDDAGHWQNPDFLSSIAEEVEAEPCRKHTLTAKDLRAIVETKFWPTVAETVKDAMNEIRGARLANPTDSCDAVILAGGTCQLSLIEMLFRNTFGGDPFFANCRYLRGKNFVSAVSEGLAIEASANSRMHDIRPTRVAPYLQDDIRLLVSHRKDTLAPPRKLRGAVPGLSDKPRDGILISAPKGILPLIDRKLQWTFSLVQKPREIFLQFEKLDPFQGNVLPDFIRSVERVKLAKMSGEPSSDVRLDLVVKPDGFADVALEVFSPGDGMVRYPAGEVDLHDLSEMAGSLFYGVDFGTSSTLVSYINMDDTSLSDPLPERYTVEPRVVRRAASIEDRARELMSRLPRANEQLEALSDQIVADYVYHSNRIEGSLLNRGQTAEVLHSLPETRSHSASATMAKVARLSYIDDAGEIKTISRPIQDAVAAVNLRDAFSLVREWANDPDFRLSPFFLKQLHALVTRGDDHAVPGSFRTGPVKIEQTSFVPPDALHVSDLVEGMFRDIDGSPSKSFRPLVQASTVHARFVSIHPFADGNGRIARLLANYFLWRSGLPGILLPWENRDRYYDALEECNSRELSTRGNLSDLTMLFCDLFEDVVLQLEEAVTSATDLDVPVVESKDLNDSRMTNLLAQLTKQKSALNLEAQYKRWLGAQETILAGVRHSIDDLSRGFRAAWGGGVELQEFPLIDEDTYKAIRQRRRFSRTWFFRTKLVFPKVIADLIFFYGPNSVEARTADETTAFTVSLHGAKFDIASARYIPFREEQWSRVKEILHNGSALGVLAQARDDGYRVEYGDEARVENWFAMIAEDAILNLAGIDLASIA